MFNPSPEPSPLTPGRDVVCPRESGMKLRVMACGLSPKASRNRSRIAAGAVTALPAVEDAASVEGGDFWEAMTPRTLRALETGSSSTCGESRCKRRLADKRQSRSKKRRLDLAAGSKVMATWFETDPTPFPAIVLRVFQDKNRIDLLFDDGYVWECAPTSTVVALEL